MYLQKIFWAKMALASLVPISEPKKVLISGPTPSHGPCNEYCPHQNHYVPRHINNMYINSYWQCCGSESGSTGSTCFRASWIRIRIHQSEVWIRIRLRIWILLSPSKKVRKTLIPTALRLLFTFYL
jgi:hypothetical protein